MRFASYGHWSRFAPGTADPESYVEQALDDETAGCDLYLVAAAFRQAVDAKLPEDVTLAGTHFLGPERMEDSNGTASTSARSSAESTCRCSPRASPAPSDPKAADNSE